MEVEVITDPSQSHVPFADWDVEIVDLGEHWKPWLCRLYRELYYPKL